LQNYYTTEFIFFLLERAITPAVADDSIRTDSFANHFRQLLHFFALSSLRLLQTFILLGPQRSSDQFPRRKTSASQRSCVTAKYLPYFDAPLTQYDRQENSKIMPYIGHLLRLDVTVFRLVSRLLHLLQAS
jgi:hypothetical protein